MKTNLVLADKIKEKSVEGCVHTFSVELDKKQVEDTCQSAIVRLQSVVSLPGFRTGKVPLSMIKAQFPSMVRDEAVEISAKAALPEIFKMSKLNPVVQPLLQNLKYEEDKVLSFEIQIEVPPVIEPKDYEKIKATKKVREITDKDVDTYINQVREYNAYLKPVEEGTAINKNHFIIVDYENWENGQKVAGSEVKGDIIDLSNPQTVVGLPEAVIGAKKGETKEFTSKFGDKEMQFKVTVNEVKEKVVPALDEEFFKNAGVKNIDELKANVRKMLEDNAAESSDKDLAEQLENALVKNNPITLPPTLVREETEELIKVYKKRLPEGSSIDNEKMMEKLKPVAERNLSLTYILHYIAKKEKIEATDAELDEELTKILQRLNTEDEKKKGRELFEQRKEYIRSSMIENKTLLMIKERATIKEEKVK